MNLLQFAEVITHKHLSAAATDKCSGPQQGSAELAGLGANIDTNHT